MREGISLLRRAGASRPVALGALIWLLADAASYGQVPQPEVPQTERRSGLFTRWVPIEPHLPPDPRRDTFWDTRWGDQPDTPHPNSIKGGGMMGKVWKSKCVASVYPFFYGAPGQSSITADCYPSPHKSGRFFSSLFHPFKPVGMYYDQGSYVPIHDFEPLVPGPGPFVWPWYYRGPGGG
ncbi:hypothetical protein [Singulisphaera sp. PoT]|uniref:hypothetical protein n=1 Tax=Singulisphaera sp. PoT TaxID=3411797 RepID=UPI003BF55834